MTPFRLLTVDDHPVVLSGLRLLFGPDPRFSLCGEASTAAEACERAAQLQPDMVVTDLVLGGADGIALVEALHVRVPAALILVYSSHDDMLWARHALRAGACGYVSKAEPLEAVAAALDAASRGGVAVSATVQRLLAHGTQGAAFEPHDVSLLSARELQILGLIGRGCSLQDMAASLGLSVKTIGTYRERLKTKLGFDTARMLDRFAAEQAARTSPAR